MLDLLREGGVPMFFVVVFGVLTLSAAGLFAARGDRRRLGFIGALGLATALSVAGAVCADLAAVGHHGLAMCAPQHLDPLTCLLLGMAESMAPAIIGFTVLSLAAMLTAVGMSRTARAAAVSAPKA
ncbi:MAG TPA: hypothetical protein VN962_25390 [Polyangia bacterium]|nr:hypothetical protein [Polyangia bacterium]